MKLNKKHFFMFAGGILLLHVVLLIKLKFTAWPEMLLWPYLLNNGLSLYKDIAIAHTPLLIVVISFFYKLFGTGVFQLQIFTWLVILAGDLLLFWVSSKIWDKKIALKTLFIYVFLQLFYDGNAMWFDLALVPLSIVEFIFIYKNKYFAAGLVWAMMMFTKQTGVWFLLPVMWSLLKTKNIKRNFFNFSLGSFGILLIGIFFIFKSGIVVDFYKWALNFGIFILPHAPGQISFPSIRTLMVAGFPFLLSPLFLWTKNRIQIPLLLWMVAGGLGTYPRFEYFHFQPALPFLAITLILVTESNKFKFFTSLYIVGFLYLFANFFIRNFSEGVRFYESDVLHVVSYVKKNTVPGDYIYVLNWWDNIYALTGTKPAVSPWVPQLAWYQELPGIQQKEVMDLRNTRPNIIIFKPYELVGLGSYSPRDLYEHIRVNYHLKEKINGIEILVPNK